MIQKVLRCAWSAGVRLPVGERVGSGEASALEKQRKRDNRPGGCISGRCERVWNIPAVGECLGVVFRLVQRRLLQ